MGGVAVTNGSTLSTTGEMLVSCNVPYVLAVDGVEWEPIASAGGVDTYLLSTSGVVRILINGIRYFMFTNSIIADFAIDRVYAFRDVGTSDVESRSSSDRYLQAEFSTAEGYIQLRVKAKDKTAAELQSLGITTNNDTPTNISLTESGYLRFYLRNYDWSTYGAVFVGNVLVAFIEVIA